MARIREGFCHYVGYVVSARDMDDLEVSSLDPLVYVVVSYINVFDPRVPFGRLREGDRGLVVTTEQSRSRLRKVWLGHKGVHLLELSGSSCGGHVFRLRGREGHCPFMVGTPGNEASGHHIQLPRR